jgi:hypothetical protein
VVGNGFVLVDWPLPWPRDAGDVEALAPLREALDGTGIRVQLVVPDKEAPGRRVVLHRRRPTDGGWFAGFARTARTVDPDDVVATAAELVASDAGAGDDTDDTDRAAVDVLVCGHGSRDRCCGSMGTSLARDATTGLTVWRTSHTGGHRFAPTGMVLPDGTAWAFLDADALRRVATRSGPLDDLLPRYRGSTGIGSREVQAVERVAFGDVGWAWLEHRRRGVVLDDGRVRVEALAPDGTPLAWEAEVTHGRRLPVPDCGQPIEAAKKYETELVVGDVTRLTGDRVDSLP